MAVILSATATKKEMEDTMAVFLSFLLFISTVILPRLVESSSEVTSSIMEIAEISRLTSQKSSGNITLDYSSLRI